MIQLHDRLGRGVKPTGKGKSALYSLGTFYAVLGTVFSREVFALEAARHSTGVTL